MSLCDCERSNSTQLWDNNLVLIAGLAGRARTGPTSLPPSLTDWLTDLAALSLSLPAQPSWTAMKLLRSSRAQPSTPLYSTPLHSNKVTRWRPANTQPKYTDVFIYHFTVTTGSGWCGICELVIVSLIQEILAENALTNCQKHFEGRFRDKFLWKWLTFVLHCSNKHYVYMTR